jgi:hypothetical protein
MAVLWALLDQIVLMNVKIHVNIQQKMKQGHVTIYLVNVYMVVKMDFMVITVQKVVLT